MNYIILIEGFTIPFHIASCPLAFRIARVSTHRFDIYFVFVVWERAALLLSNSIWSKVNSRSHVSRTLSRSEMRRTRDSCTRLYRSLIVDRLTREILHLRLQITTTCVSTVNRVITFLLRTYSIKCYGGFYESWLLPVYGKVITTCRRFRCYDETTTPRSVCPVFCSPFAHFLTSITPTYS